VENYSSGVVIGFGVGKIPALLPELDTELGKYPLWFWIRIWSTGKIPFLVRNHKLSNS
jgi:hypothetical protein